METQLKKKKKKDKQKLHMLKAIGTMFKWMGPYWPLLLVAFGILYLVSYVRTIIPLFGRPSNTT